MNKLINSFIVGHASSSMVIFVGDELQTRAELVRLGEHGHVIGVGDDADLVGGIHMD